MTSAGPTPISWPRTRAGGRYLQNRHPPRRISRFGVMAGLDELARRLNVTRAEMLAVDRPAGSRHHGCDQRAAGAQGRKGRAADHRRPSRRHRNARGSQARSLRPAFAAAGAPGAARTTFWCQGTAQGQRRGFDSARSKIARRRHCRHRQSGATSVAVCFLHSYLNPVHELAAVERLKQALPDISISRSSDVLPQIKEYERVSTTIVNAYVEPIVRRYLTNLEARLAEAGFKGSLFVVLSHGGMARSRKLRGLPRARCSQAPRVECPAGGAVLIWSASPTSCRSTWAAPRPTSR